MDMGRINRPLITLIMSFDHLRRIFIAYFDGVDLEITGFQ